MRKYALVVLNNKDEIIDRYNLDITTNPTGNGFELDLSTITSDLEDIITKVVQKKNKITFVVNQIHESYQKANALAGWIQQYSTENYQMALEYDDGVVTKYCVGKVTKLEKNEIQPKNVLQQKLEFTQLTPYFIKRDNTITIQVASKGKSYPFTYPYSYGASVVENNEIDNPYILDIPLIVVIDGKINTPKINLMDTNGEVYTTVETIEPLQEGEQLIINSAQRKVVKVTKDGEEKDYVPFMSVNYDTFLRAKSGISKININTNSENVGTGFKLTGSWRQYNL